MINTEHNMDFYVPKSASIENDAHAINSEFCPSKCHKTLLASSNAFKTQCHEKHLCIREVYLEGCKIA